MTKFFSMDFFLNKKIIPQYIKNDPFLIICGIIFFIKKNSIEKKNLVILGQKNATWSKLKKYDTYGKKLKSTTNLYFQS